MKRLPVLIVMVFLVSFTVFVNSASGAGFTGKDYLAKGNGERLKAVTTLVSDAKRGGVVIKQSPVSYCRKLDVFYIKHPDMKSQQLATVLKTLIVMEYDWDQAGVDKEELARKTLGDKTYEENKKRVSKKY